MKTDETTIIHDLGITADIRTFTPEEGAKEKHIILHVAPRGQQFPDQLQRIYKGYESICETIAHGYKPVFMRYFLTDATNQAEHIHKEANCAVSIIQQPPLDGSKVALWIYMVEGADVKNITTEDMELANVIPSTTVVDFNDHKQIWNMGSCISEGDSAFQTEKLLTSYEHLLSKFNSNLADNCQRTWFFVRDVDTNYAGLVKARRDNFTEQGLTSDTHYIASTGIGGSPADTKALVQMGCYAVTGISQEQIKYLYAPTHLNPTYEYGVTFERGTAIRFTDRTHIYISGTASINNKGEVVHVGDIEKQAERMCENVKTLLAEANAKENDVMQIIVYLRDIADYDTARRIVENRYPTIPCVYTYAPVCRPQWLIEMECIAII